MMDVQKEIKAQQEWIRTHGETLEGYIRRYGDPDLVFCYGEGGTAIYEADVAHLDTLHSLNDHQHLRKARCLKKLAPEKIQDILHDLRKHASLQDASFGFDTETLTLKYPSTGIMDHKLEWGVNEFIKEKTRLHRNSWILPLIDKLIDWAEGE